MYYTKYCPTHGTRRWLVSRNGDHYLRFDRHYHTLFPADEPPAPGGDPFFFITNRCNQDCNYCATEANRYDYFGYAQAGTRMRTGLCSHLAIECVRERMAADHSRNGHEAAAQQKRIPNSQF